MTLHLRTTVFILLTLSCFSLKAQTAIDSLDGYLKDLADQGLFSGNVLLADRDGVLLRKSYGYADFVKQTPLSEDAVLELASVSKQFTAAAVSLLVKDGSIDLDAPISKYLTALAAYPTVTVRHLIHHTGGLPDYMHLGDSLKAAENFVTNDTLLNWLATYEPEVEFTPGSQHSYSNTGYAVLASLVEKVSGQPFGDFLRRRIFQPLGMKNSQVYRRRYESRQVPGFVPGVVWADSMYVIPDSLTEYAFVRQLDGIVGDGMVKSTLDDLYLWDRALAKGKLLDTALLFRPAMLADSVSTEYGFGWQIKQHEDYGRMINHSGGWPGVQTFISRFPDTDRTVILLRNDDGGNNVRIQVLRNANRALFGLPLEVERFRPLTPMVPTQQQIATFSGTYALAPTFKFEVYAENGRLLLRATGQSPSPLAATDDPNRFAVVDVNADISFVKDADGKVTKLLLHQGDREMSATREQ